MPKKTLAQYVSEIGRGKQDRAEERHQRALAVYLDHRHLLWFHVPNERSDKLQRFILAKLGVKRGVPDVIIPEPVFAGEDIMYFAMAIELKRPGRAQVTEAQVKWLGDLVARNWVCEVCYGVAEAIAFVDKHYGPNLEALRSASLHLRCSYEGAEAELLDKVLVSRAPAG